MTQKCKLKTNTIYWYLYLTLPVKEVVWLKYTVQDYFGLVSTLEKTVEIWKRAKEDCGSAVLQIKKFNLFSLSKWRLRSNLITVCQCFHLVKMFNGRGLADCVDDKVRKLNLLYARAKYIEAWKMVQSPSSQGNRTFQPERQHHRFWVQPQHSCECFIFCPIWVQDLKYQFDFRNCSNQF